MSEAAPVAEAVLRPFGESALVVEFGDTVEPETQRRVRQLTARLDASAAPGLLEVVPSFRSVLIEFDPAVTDGEALLAALPDVEEDDAAPARTWRVPVRVDAEAAEDAAEAAEALGIDVATLHERLLASELSVGMYGFVPGNCYMTGVDPSLSLPRRTRPRPPVPAGSLIIAVGQAVFLPVSMPTGWYVVGRTTARMFDVEARPPVPFAVGDRVRLRAVEPAEFAALMERNDRGVEAL